MAIKLRRTIQTVKWRAATNEKQSSLIDPSLEELTTVPALSSAGLEAARAMLNKIDAENFWRRCNHRRVEELTRSKSKSRRLNLAELCFDRFGWRMRR